MTTIAPTLVRHKIASAVSDGPMVVVSDGAPIRRIGDSTTASQRLASRARAEPNRKDCDSASCSPSKSAITSRAPRQP